VLSFKSPAAGLTRPISFLRRRGGIRNGADRLIADGNLQLARISCARAGATSSESVIKRSGRLMDHRDYDPLIAPDSPRDVYTAQEATRLLDSTNKFQAAFDEP